jgi:hypothetical protein
MSEALELTKRGLQFHFALPESHGAFDAHGRN